MFANALLTDEIFVDWVTTALKSAGNEAAAEQVADTPVQYLASMYPEIAAYGPNGFTVDMHIKWLKSMITKDILGVTVTPALLEAAKDVYHVKVSKTDFSADGVLPLRSAQVMTADVVSEMVRKSKVLYTDELVVTARYYITAFVYASLLTPEEQEVLCEPFLNASR